MDSANLWEQLAEASQVVRIAQADDAQAITHLLQKAPFVHIHADWHYPADWLGLATFAVVPDERPAGKFPSLSDRWFAEGRRLHACLAVAADPPPAAWVRVAAAADLDRSASHMASMLAAMAADLRAAQTSQVAWLLVDESPEIWLPDLGFELVNAVITYENTGISAEHRPRPSQLEIRPVQESDFPALAEIEARAFDPLWRHSAHGLALAWKQAFSFEVAWLHDQPVGFQFSSATRRGAHLSRITVDPAFQNQGIGTALFADALQGYRKRGIAVVTLNTQLDNTASQRFYERFGFRQNGERFPIWSIDL